MRGLRLGAVIGVARRMPELVSPKVRWHEADIADANLVELFRGADAVIHAAWLIQPSHDESVMERTNIHGTARVLDAVREAKVPALMTGTTITIDQWSRTSMRKSRQITLVMPMARKLVALGSGAWTALSR